MNQRPDQMLEAGLMAPTMIPMDAFRIFCPDAIVPGAFWYFTRERYPSPKSTFTLVGYIPPTRSPR